MTLTIRAADGVGAYVSNIDLNNLETDVVAALRSALGEYGVLFFRDQSLTLDAHIDVARAFGEININRFFQKVDTHPQIAEVRKEAHQISNIGEQWHTDHSYDQIPALGSILVARSLPTSGGDTIFSSMFSAYDGLPGEVQQRIDQLTATHSSRHAFGPDAYSADDEDDFGGRLGNTSDAKQDAIHPVAIRHPISGKRAIYVNPDFTVCINGLSETDSQELLEYLYEHCQQEQFTHRFQWQEGSVAFWDNRATWHKALNDYPGQARLMHRITVEGEHLH